MTAEKGKLVLDGNVEQAYQRYRQLKLEVDEWMRKRASFWLDSLRLNEESPYLPIADLPQDAIIELWQRLNVSAKVEISDLALREMWEHLKLGKNAMEPEMATRFQMAVCGVAKLASQVVNKKGVPEQNSNPRASENPERNVVVCPVCGEVTTLAVLTEPNGKRVMHCATCNFEWPVQRTGCLFCGSEDSNKLVYFDNEAFPGIEMGVCQVCGQYFKEFDERRLGGVDYFWEDMRTLPLNFATERWIEEQVRKDNQIN